MQRILTALKRRPSTVHFARFISTEEELEQSFYWKIPLQPKVSSLYEKYESTLFYSTHIEGHKLKLTYQDRRQLENKIKAEKQIKVRTRPIPLALKFLNDGQSERADEERPNEAVMIDENMHEDTELDPNRLTDDEEDDFKERSLEQRRLIAGKATHIDEVTATIFERMKKTRESIQVEPNTYSIEKYPAEWMLDYETYDEGDDYADKSQYGTPDPTIPISKVPCYGCGGLLQCVDPSLPGYLPSELMRNQHNTVLRNLTCQRCHFLINYNTALNLKVDPEDYINMIAEVKDKKGLVILMVDLLDFPCSIWPEMIDVVGKDRPMVLVGNKVDLLPKDSSDYLKHVKTRLEDAIIDSGIPLKNIKHTCLISAQTNYGVEDLITKLHAIWRFQGDVYLMGCTNVGKSTLFNALLRSDYCQVQASSIIKRATASIWPGTTLKMLKFPILRPSDKKLYERNMRLRMEQRAWKLQNKLTRSQFKEKKRVTEPTMLIGHIGQTFLEDPEDQMQSHDLFSLGSAPALNQMKYLNEKKFQYLESRWCYDTPGVIQPDQVVHLLTTEELMRVMSKKIILPRSYYIHRGMTLFLAGLGRVDYINGPEKIRLSVFASAKLPVLIVKTDEADNIYEDCIGTEIMGVPLGDEERLKKFPSLEKPDQSIVIQSDEHGDWKSCCDIILSSAGWVSVNLPRVTEAEFHAWTPECRGIHVRQPALLPFAASAYRGKRILDTPAYRQKIPSVFRMRERRQITQNLIEHNFSID